ncbi:MAG: flnE [Alphaproteobacteria bacterium]|nr:flnE [Alphaproteobacteria bacterium]
MSASFWVEMLGAEVRFTDAGGHRTRSLVAGTGDPVILLHGITGHAETWTRNLNTLGTHNQLHALDMLGHGFTAKPDIDYDVPTLGRHVLSYMDACGIDQAIVGGQSLGGWVAGWIAVNHADRVRGYASITGAGLEVSKDAAELSRSVGAKVASATSKATGAPTRESVRERLEWLMFDKSVVTEELVDTRFRIYTDPEFMAVSGKMVANMTGGGGWRLTRENLAQIACPALVFWSRQNPTMPWEVGEEASRIIPDARWYLMEDAGHWPQFEKPAEFNGVMGSFLREVSGHA